MLKILFRLINQNLSKGSSPLLFIGAHNYMYVENKVKKHIKHAANVNMFIEIGHAEVRAI